MVIAEQKCPLGNSSEFSRLVWLVIRTPIRAMMIPRSCINFSFALHFYVWDSGTERTFPVPKDCLHLPPPATAYCQHQSDHLFWIRNAPHLQTVHLQGCCQATSHDAHPCVCVCVCALGKEMQVCALFLRKLVLVCVHQIDINTLSMSMTPSIHESHGASHGLTLLSALSSCVCVCARLCVKSLPPMTDGQT